MQSGTSELKDHPVLELFLQHRVMEELCTRAIHDKPQGLLPVILAATTSIMRTLRYPLLPHQRVHKPLCQLLTHATDISAQYALAAKRLPSSDRADMISYTRRIDANLANLILCLWRKIYEAPQTLDFFSFIDHTASAAGVTTAETPHHQLVQLDLIKCLIPLMGKQKIGATAKEALLLAVSLHDVRINYYILHETRLMHNVVTELSKKYVQSVDSLLLTVVPSSPSSLVPLVTHDATAAFEKVLRFCSALALASCANVSRPSLSHNNNSTKTVFVPQKSVDLFSEICREVREVFISTCLVPLMMEHAEQQVIATQAVCRLMLRELMAGSAAAIGVGNREGQKHIHPIALLISQQLIRSSELSDALLARASSASKDVSLSTLLLLESLVGCAALTDLEIVFLRSDANSDANSSEEGSVPATTNIESVLNTLQFPSQHHQDGGSKGSKKVPASVENYMNFAVDCIMSKASFSFSGSDAVESASDEPALSLGRGPMLSLLLKKLKAFSSLRFEEQLAVTGLVQQAVNFLCVLVCSSDSERKSQLTFVELMNIFKTIKSAEREITAHVKQIADASYKMELVRAILSSSDAASTAKLRKVLDKEGPQVIRILESTVLLRELIHELHGYLLAVKKLRVIFASDALSSFAALHDKSAGANRGCGDINDPCDDLSDCASVSDFGDCAGVNANKEVLDREESEAEPVTEADFEKDWAEMNDLLSELATDSVDTNIIAEVV